MLPYFRFYLVSRKNVTVQNGRMETDAHLMSQAQQYSQAPRPIQTAFGRRLNLMIVLSF